MVYLKMGWLIVIVIGQISNECCMVWVNIGMSDEAIKDRKLYVSIRFVFMLDQVLKQGALIARYSVGHTSCSL